MAKENNDTWATRWDEGRIGFHRDSVNPSLLKYGHLIHSKDANKVLVPLCGKSLDMHWLKDQGFEVTGVELVHKAIQDFFTEWGSPASRQTIGGSSHYQGDGVSILNANIFQVPSEFNKQFNAVYDRAAIVALPPEQRKDYATALLSLLDKKSKLLFVTYQAPTKPNEGPPYIVHDDEIPQLFSKYKTTLLETIRHTPESEPKLKKIGIEWMKEQIWLVEIT